jgi:hypothetical protein
MRPFLHERLLRLEDVLELSSAALRAYTALELNLAATVVRFLDGGSLAYRELGLPDGENDLLALQAQFTAARGGLHPVTLERVLRNRRELERAVALQVLQAGSARLRADRAGARQALDDAQERLLPIVAVGIQKGLLTGTGDLEACWLALTGDPDIQPAARPIAMTVSLPDILIVLGDLLAPLTPAVLEPPVAMALA